MSMLIIFTLLLAITSYQIIIARREYAHKKQLEEKELKEKSISNQAMTKSETGHYAIAPGESLAPQLKPKHFRKTKAVNQS
ncbi:hypothetical protein GO730_07710 [Spirosoma sp. HMF3257]|uniref:Uncharacterized protein n=1 Tax=Spirosoma telluris TaxID=2183553 RepID=A0A327NNM5_9BACT|nr:hypothetical protein [Spirosoma telluris]RAI74228.1 hypothetical protein HMF3257_07630 [Spirosoma telluris]